MDTLEGYQLYMIDSCGNKGFRIDLLELSHSVLQDTVSKNQNPEELLEQLIHEVTLSLAEDVGKALERLQRIQKVADTLELSTASVRSRRSLARAHSYKGNYQSAIEVCSQGRKIAIENQHIVEGARIRMASMHALTELGRFDDAIEAGCSARNELVESQEYALAARVEINLGIVYQRMERTTDALQCFDSARESLGDDDSSIGPLENNRGEALLLNNEFQKAEDAFSAALHAFMQNDSVLFSAIAEGNLADLALRQGHLTEALTRFENARQRFEQAGSPGHLARMMAEQAEAKSLLGLSTEALNEYHEALVQLESHELPLELSRTQFGLGSLLLKKGEHEYAESLLYKASSGLAKLNHPVMKARVDIARAEGFYASDMVDKARKMVTKNLPEIGEHPIDAIPAYLLLATIAMNQKDFVEASAQISIAQNRADQAGIHQLSAAVAKVKGDNYLFQHEYESAATAYAVAIEHVEQLRSSLQAQRFKMALASEVANLYKQYIASLVAIPNKHNLDEIFQACESARSRTLLEEVVAGKRSIRNHECTYEDSRFVELDVLQSRIEGLYSRLVDEDNALNRKTVLRELQTLEQKSSDLESRLASTNDHRANVYRKPLSLSEIQSSLDDSTIVSTYFTVEDQLQALVITNSNIELIKDIESIEKLRKLVTRLQFHISRVVGRNPNEARRRKVEIEINQILEELSKSIIYPIEKLIRENGTLVVIPNQDMYGIPFAALPIDGRRLVERCEVLLCPSASLFIAIKESKRVSMLTSLIVGRADETAPAMTEEAKAIAQILNNEHVSLLVDEEATIESVKVSMKTAGLIHFACHGRFDQVRPHLSGVQLADGWLSAGAIHRLGVAADTVILGSCDSGLVSFTQSKEMLGLARSFLSSGAKSVLGTLWTVDDLSSKKILCTFHKKLSSMRNGPAAAIRATQLEALQQDVAIWDWAGFSLIGVGR